MCPICEHVKNIAFSYYYEFKKKREIEYVKSNIDYMRYFIDKKYNLKHYYPLYKDGKIV